MENNYTPPSAAVRDPAPSKRRFIHSLYAATAGFTTILVLIVTASFVQTGLLTSFGYGRAFATCTLFSAVAGVAVLPFRKLAWYWAVIIGSFASFVSFYAVIKTFF